MTTIYKAFIFNADIEEATKYGLGKNVGKWLDVAEGSESLSRYKSLMQASPSSVIWSWENSFTKNETEKAEFFLMKFKNYFEPAPEETGTTYDYSKICPLCG